jgi:tetratricopeptide (TPR) repeat protein
MENWMRRVLIVLVGLGVAWVVVGRLKERPTERKFPSVSSSVVAASRMPYDATQAQKTVAFHAGRVQNDPEGAIGYALLAAAYLQRGRETGDVADAVKAEQAARRSLKIRERGNVQALSLLASSLLTQHRFREALAAAERGATLWPGFAQFVLIQADVWIELGEYGKARKILDSVREKDIFGQATSARLYEIEGRSERAREILSQAAETAVQNLDVPHEAAAWFLVRYGNSLEKAGKLEEAEGQYRRALEIFPQDYRAMTGLARTAAMRQDWKWAVDWARKAEDIAPSPEVVALHGDACLALGEVREAEKQYRLVETMGRLAKAQGVVHDRQRVLFYADHGRNLDEALRLARQEIAVRKDVYGWDTLAWACHQKGLYADADAAMQKALAQGTEDAMLFYHAGRIALARKEKTRARMYLERALALNPYFHWFAAQEARGLLE